MTLDGRKSAVRHCSLVLAVVSALGMAAVPTAAWARGAVLLVGGGSEDYGDWSDRPYGWMVQQAGNGKIAVLSTDRTATEWIPEYFESLGALDAYNVIVPDTTTANSDAAVNAILDADGIFIKGGDQGEYLDVWVNTRLSAALEQRFDEGAVLAGTSAGAMIQGEVIYDALNGSIYPYEALANPYDTMLSLSYGFLNTVPGFVVDTHFTTRGRLGRLGPFMGRSYTDFGLKVGGIGVDQESALAIYPDGITAEVMGGGAVTLLRWTSTTSMTFERGVPPDMRNLKADILTPGYKFDLKTGAILARPSTARTVTTPAVPKPYGSLSFWSDEVNTPPFASDIKPFAKEAGKFKTVVVLAPTAADGQYLVQPLREALLRPKVIGWKSATSSDGSSVESSAGVVLVLPRPSDDATGLLPGMPVGDALARAVKAGKPLALAVEGNTLVGSRYISNLGVDPSGLYYGTLSIVPGLNLTPGIATMPLAWASTDYADNRNGGLIALLAAQGGGWGILQDLDCSALVTGGVLTVQGDESSVIVDARTLKASALTSYTMLGATSPRQSAALEGVMVHYVAPGVEMR